MVALSTIGGGIGEAKNYTIEQVKIPVVEAQTIELDKEDPLASNCYLYAKSLVPNLPRTSEIVTNTVFPNLGGITVLDYRGTTHYVVNQKITADGVLIKESNFGGPGYSERFLTWEYLKEHNARYWNQVE